MLEDFLRENGYLNYHDDEIIIDGKPATINDLMDDKVVHYALLPCYNYSYSDDFDLIVRYNNGDYGYFYLKSNDNALSIMKHCIQWNKPCRRWDFGRPEDNDENYRYEATLKLLMSNMSISYNLYDEHEINYRLDNAISMMLIAERKYILDEVARLMMNRFIDNY